MNAVLSLLREDLKGFAGYSSAAKESNGATPAIKLDANESPWPPFGNIGELCALHRYAQPQPLALRERMGAYWGVRADQILLTAGSDQGIDVLIRAFCQAGRDQIMICPPTFSMYAVYAKLQGAAVLTVKLKENGQLDVSAMLAAATTNTKLIFIPAPNAPMGQAMDRADILALCAASAGQSLIVIDEAYVSFSNNPAGFVPDLALTENLVVLRTLSKAHALAGERIGCVIGSAALVAALCAIVSPYPITQSGLRGALDVFSPAGLAECAMQCKKLIIERTRMRERLMEAPEVRRVYPSEGNFLFLETENAPAFLAKLKAYDIQARNMEAQVKGAVRISLGTASQNDMVLRALGIEALPEQIEARLFSVQRQTKETWIDVAINLDDPAVTKIETGLGFFDHMLQQIATHGNMGLVLQAKGDLEVDVHHTIEDCGLALGEAIKGALGDKKGLARFGFTAPLDESLAQVTLDLSARPFLVMTASWLSTPSDGMAPDLAEHFLRSFTTTLGATLHVTVTGENNHHMIEACFKALGRALRQAVRREGDTIPSTKGQL